MVAKDAMNDECSCNGTSCGDGCEQEYDQSINEKIQNDNFRARYR
jgi:hypothetical protein